MYSLPLPLPLHTPPPPSSTSLYLSYLLSSIYQSYICFLVDRFACLFVFVGSIRSINSVGTPLRSYNSTDAIRVSPPASAAHVVVQNHYEGQGQGLGQGLVQGQGLGLGQVAERELGQGLVRGSGQEGPGQDDVTEFDMTR